MSIAAVDWAFKQTTGASSLKFLLVALANYADEDGCCWPSIFRLSEDTEQNRKTVLRNIAKLKRANLVADTGHRKGKTQSIPIYRLKMRSSPKIGTPEAVPILRGSSPYLGRKQSLFRATDPSGTVNEPPNGVSLAAPPKKNTPDDKRFWIVSKQLENAKGKFRSALLKEQAVLTSRITGIAQPVPSAPVMSQPEIVAPPADPAKAQALLNDLKASVAAAVPVRPLAKVMKQVRFKRPVKPV